MRRSFMFAPAAILWCGAISARAQIPPTVPIAGTWVGGIESGSDFGFYSATIESQGATLVGVASLAMRDLSGALRRIARRPSRGVKRTRGRTDLSHPVGPVAPGPTNRAALRGKADCRGHTRAFLLRISP